MRPLPIIRMEVEHMKHSMLTALTDYEVTLCKELRDAVERFCAPENIQKVVTEQTWSTLTAVIKEEVDRFFRCGKGRETVREAVIKKLEEGTTFTPLDKDWRE